MLCSQTVHVSYDIVCCSWFLEVKLRWRDLSVSQDLVDRVSANVLDQKNMKGWCTHLINQLGQINWYNYFIELYTLSYEIFKINISYKLRNSINKFNFKSIHSLTVFIDIMDSILDVKETFLATQVSNRS